MLLHPKDFVCSMRNTLALFRRGNGFYHVVLRADLIR